LAAHSSAVVEVTALPDPSETPADQAGTTNIPATITQVSVDRLLWGSVEGDNTLAIRQIGSPKVEVSNEPLLSPGTKYLVFVSPFEFTPGTPTGQWIITNDEGLYSSADSSYTLLDTDDLGLPGSMTSAQLLSLLPPDS